MKLIQILMVCCLASVSGWTQVNSEIQTANPYYITVNSMTGVEEMALHNGVMHLEYQDNIGTAPEIELFLYNWKSELLGVLQLDKTLGLNHYSFSLASAGIDVPVGEMIRCRMVNENKVRFEWRMRLVDDAGASQPLGAIQVNPVTLATRNQPDNTLIEFYGSASQGRAPYRINWYVIDETKTKLVYQPREEKISQDGIVSMIMVDREPAYYVMLLVTDACGNVDKKMVYVSKQPRRKKIHSLFVEPLRDLEKVTQAAEPKN